MANRSKTYYRDPDDGRTVSWRPSHYNEVSSYVSFGDSLKNLELEDKKFVEWMKKNYIDDLKYTGIENGVPYTWSSEYGKYPVQKLYNENVGSSTDTYGGRYEHHLEQKRGGYKPRSKKSHKKGFKNIHAKKTRKFHK